MDLKLKPHGPWVTYCALALSVGLAYGEVLDNGFFEIDDPSLLDHVSRGERWTARFRPLWVEWNTLLFRGFGLSPGPYYAVGLVVHAISACACAALVRRVTSSAAAGLLAGLVFALSYAPHQSILWISANCGLLSVAFVLLAGLSWHSHVTSPGRTQYALTILAMVGAMASKEDCVILAPLLLGIDACVRGAAVFRPQSLAQRYGTLGMLAAVYVALAFHPSVWASSPAVGRYELGVELIPRLLGNSVLLFAIGQTSTPDTSAILVIVGAVSIAALGYIAWRLRANGRVLWTGMAVALVGLAPTLPGGLPLAGARFTYPSMIGVALMFGGVTAAFLNWTRARESRSAWRASAALATALWLGAQVAAIHSVESWRYERSAERLKRLVSTTRREVLALRREPDPPSTMAVVDPEIWNPADYASAVRLFLGEFAAPSRIEWVGVPEPGQRWSTGTSLLDPARGAVFTTVDDGHLERLGAGSLDTTLSWLASSRRRRFTGGTVDRLPVVWLDLFQESVDVGK